MAFAAPSVVFRAEAPDLRGFPVPTAVPWRKRLDPPALLTFASPSERSSERWSRSSSSRGIRRSPLHRHDRCASTPGRRIPHRHDAARRRTRSARVVSHHLDGFLRTSARGSVAPRSRSWGSSRFGPEPSSRRQNPSKGSPRRQPCHVTVAVCLPAVTGEMSKPVAEALGDSGPKPTNHQVEAPVCRSRPPRRPARARCEHPRHRRGRSTYRGTRGNHDERATRTSEACRSSESPAGTVAEAAGLPGAPSRTQANLRADGRARRNISRSGRLRGLAPPTSPLRHTAVASGATLDPSMGFVPSKVPDQPLPNGVAAPSGDPSPGSPTEAEASEAPGESVR